MLPGSLVEDPDLAQVFPDLVVSAAAMLVHGGGPAPVWQAALAVFGDEVLQYAGGKPEKAGWYLLLKMCEDPAEIIPRRRLEASFWWFLVMPAALLRALVSRCHT
jgi:hypothetical protein